LTIDVHLVSSERGGGCHGVISADHLIGNNALRANVAGGEKLNATPESVRSFKMPTVHVVTPT
jgi:hypothetical protein